MPKHNIEMDQVYSLERCADCPLKIKPSLFKRILHTMPEYCDGPIELVVGARVTSTHESIRPIVEYDTQKTCPKSTKEYQLAKSDQIQVQVIEAFEDQFKRQQELFSVEEQPEWFREYSSWGTCYDVDNLTPGGELG